MTDVDEARVALERHLEELTAHRPLEALALLASLQRDNEVSLRVAVHAAVGRHTWAEIGKALGISKQAAHQKYVASVADSLVAHRRAEKKAKRAKDAARIAHAEASHAAAAADVFSMPPLLY